MSLSTEQIHDAIRQMLVSCELKMKDYEPMTARGTLYSLGFHGEDCEQILRYIADGGFNYCLDPEYHEGEQRISLDVCYWGPDQLASRLHSLSNFRK